MADFAPRYARALAGAVVDAGMDPQAVARELDGFFAVLGESKDLREVLENPGIPLSQRLNVLDAISRQAGYARQVRNFLALLIQHGRVSSLEAIAGLYRVEVGRRMGVAEAEVITARPLAQEERRELEGRIAVLAGTEDGHLRATFREDASLIGGAIVRLGSTVYDGSVRGRLERMKERLLAG